MKSLSRNIICLIIALIVVLFLEFTGTARHFSPKGVILPLAKAEAPVSPSVVRYYSKAPASYKQLAYVNVELHFKGQATEHLMQEVDQKARSLAASIGANGLLIETSGYTEPGATPGSLMVYILHAKAIKTNAGVVS